MWSRLAIDIALHSKIILSLCNGYLINNTFFQRLQDEDELGESMGMPSVQAALHYLPLHCAASRRTMPPLTPFHCAASYR
uniref:Uncharacterized protein n=1 Tax=Oryza sativa subsp. japonica TaxID=39947 RepID=Q6K6D0_ORYSJ|nr:hypothetical protein [Oryza sativa Japonica Group]BAD23207.1 hypothetical protein [Oryza sativa Japonica Group]